MQLVQPFKWRLEGCFARALVGSKNVCAHLHMLSRKPVECVWPGLLEDLVRAELELSVTQGMQAV